MPIDLRLVFHWTNIVPMYGIADSRLVITVAPQKDIRPHGRTYPKNAVAIVAIGLVPQLTRCVLVCITHNICFVPCVSKCR
jgi:hypothetical protein